MSEAVPQVLPMAETGTKICPEKLRLYLVRQMMTNIVGMVLAEDIADANIHCGGECPGPVEESVKRSALNPAKWILGETYKKDFCPEASVVDRPPARLAVRPDSGAGDINRATSADT